MKLKSLNRYIGFFALCISFLPLCAEEEIDIWSKENKENSENPQIKIDSSNKTLNTEVFNKSKINNEIKIENEISGNLRDAELFGIYEPANSNFNLNMWSQTDAEDIRSSLKRINKIKLSKFAQNLFENTFFSFSYPPKGMDNKEFIDLKIDWMISNKRLNLIEESLKQNNKFHNKKKLSNIWSTIILRELI